MPAVKPMLGTYHAPPGPSHPLFPNADMGSMACMVLEIIGLILVGLVIGGLARLALPGPDPMGLLATAGVGIAGSLISGLIMRLAFHRVGWSFLVALLVSTGIVWLIRRSRGGRVGSPSMRYTRYR